jgi:hypothetical protein
VCLLLENRAWRAITLNGAHTSMHFLCAVIDVVRRLLPFGEISYWLTKVELLQTLACLDYTVVALFDSKIPGVIFHHVVLKLIGDSDHRYSLSRYRCILPC